MDIICIIFISKKNFRKYLHVIDADYIFELSNRNSPVQGVKFRSKIMKTKIKQLINKYENRISAYTELINQAKAGEHGEELGQKLVIECEAKRKLLYDLIKDLYELI